MQTGSEGHDKENDLKIMQNLASAFPQMFMGPLGVGQQQGQQNQSQQNGSSQQQQQQDQQQLELQQLMMATLDQMNSNPQNSLQNLYLQQLMSLGGLVKSDTSPDSQQSTTPTAENTGNDEMANFMASLIASTTAPTTTTTPAVNSASLLDQLSIMQNLFGGNAPTTTASNNNPFTSTPSATSQGQTNSGVSTPMTPNGHSQQQNAAAVFSAAGNAGLLNSPSGIMSGIGGFMSPNKDSYCELCDKNFCNRYFLRTHKMKKHGIGMGPNDDGTTSPSKLPGLPFSLSLQNGSSPKSTHQASVIVNGSSGNTSGDEQSSPLSKMPKLSFPGAPELERRGSNDASAVFDAAFNGPKPSLDSLLAFTNASSPTHATTCDICGRQFSSVLAVFTHKAREHAQGVNAGDNALLSIMEQLNQTPSKPSDERSICELCDKEFESRQHLLQHQLLQHGSTNANHSTTPSQQAQAHAQAQAQAQAHQAAATNALLSMLPGGFPPLPFLLPPSLPQGFASLADLDPTGAFAAFNGNSPGGNLNSGGNKMAPKRQYSSTSKNFCDLCNKEVCNKYFLRTHMLKMHNIVIDENKTVIASIDTLEKEKLGALSFRCDICHMELKTRQSLREHKKTTHGVMPLMTPPGNRGGSVKTGSALNSAASSAGSNSNGTAFDFTNKALMDMQNDSDGNQDMGMDEVKTCPICTKTLNGMDVLYEHLKAEHSDTVPPELMAEIEKIVESQLEQQPQQEIVPSSASSISGMSTASTSNSALNKCRFCPMTFPNELETQLHYINTHPEELLAQVMGVTAASVSGASGESMEENDPAMQATTQVALQMAKANQLQKQLKPLKPFACDICRRRYRNETALSRHVNSVHKWSVKLSPRKKHVKSFISPTKISKLIHSFACTKCQKRFISRDECKHHIIQHLKAEKLAQDEVSSESAASSSDATKAMSSGNSEHTMGLPEDLKHEMKEEEEFDEELLSSYICENSGTTLGAEGSSVVDQVVSEIHEELARRNSHKEEKHSHTSGSVSPLSVQMPEGFAQPAHEQKKPFSVQSFLMRELCDNGLKGQFLNEIVAYLPVRTTITEPVQVTFELRPTPHIDAQVQHL